MDFTKAARVQTSTKDLTNTARIVSGRNGDQQVVPDIVRQSMIEQGMQNNTPFSPGTPIAPFNPVGSSPQQFDYMIGQNIVQQPRAGEAISFDTMRSMLESYDVAQMCIDARLDQIKNLEWDVVRKDNKDKTDYSADIKSVKDFLRKPDGTNLFDDWLSPFLNDLIAYDAPAFFKQRTRGGKLGSLEVIDGTTLTPMIDASGRLPKSPAPGYIQYIKGMPRYWLTADSVVYRPWRRRSNKIYGFPAVEWLLMNINQDFRQQFYFLQQFTDGSVPGVFAETPESIANDPMKIQQFQTMYDAVMIGDQSAKHKVKWIPFGSKITKMKEDKFQVEYPMFLFNKTLSAFKMTSAELGFTENVNKSSGESQENVQYRRTIRPLVRYIHSLMDEIITELGYPHLVMRYQKLGEQEDALSAAQVRGMDIKNGVISADYAAEEAYGIAPDPKNPTPRVFIFSDGLATVEDAIAQGKAKTNLTLAQAKQASQKPTAPAAPINAKEPAVDPKAKDVAAKKLAKADEDDPEKKHNVLPETDLAALTLRQDTLQEVISNFFITQPEKVAQHIYNGIKSENLTPEDAISHVDASLTSYGWQGWEKHLKPSIYSSLIETHSQGTSEASSAIGVNLSYDMINPHAVTYAEQRAGELIGTGKNADLSIADSTREFIRDTITEAVAEGKSMEDVVKILTDEYAFSDARALTIARTETALAYNKGTLLGYKMSDVPAVTVIDGDGDVECAAANGQVWSVDFASDHALQHPRCVRHFAGIPKAWFNGNYDME